MSTLGTDFSREQERCRELISAYEKIGPAGAFGMLHIKDVLRQADQAVISGNVVAMIRCYKMMKDCQ